MENELIYRKTAKEMFLHAPMTEDEKIMIFRRLNAVPAVDAVEVVRCGECEYHDYRRCHHPNHDHHEQSVWVEEDHFCGWGQRREEEHNAPD